MSDFDNSDNNKDQSIDAGTTESLPLHSSSPEKQARRKFLKGAVVATPVLLTIASRPVWARNCTLSGQLSGNLSDQGGQECAGEGCTPGYWRNRGYDINAWHPQFPPNMLFFDAFGRDAFPGKTLFEVVDRKVSGSEMVVPSGCTPPINSQVSCTRILKQLGFHSVAALQNSATSVRYDLDVQTVIDSFQVAYDNGSFSSMEQTKDAFDNLNNQYCPL